MPDYLTAEDIASTLQQEGDANISARTVHYYAELKLLPAPEYDGNRPRYTLAHLEAMRELRKQKRQGKRLNQLPVQATQATNLEQAGTLRQRAASIPASPTGPVTIQVAQGLTIHSEGWSNEALTRIVNAIHAVIKDF